jgi:hypothetical protein
MANVQAPSSQHALDLLQSALGRNEKDYPGKVSILNADPTLASRHRFGEVMAAAQASLGMCLGEIWQKRGGNVQDVTSDAHAGVHQHHGIAFMRQNGHELGFNDYGAPGSFDDEVGGKFYATRDGRFIKFEMLYPRLRDAVYRVLKCAPSARSVEQAVGKWDAEALENALRDEGAAVGVVRSAQEWRRHPVGARLAAKPVVELTKIGECDPIPLPSGLPEDGRPLRGLNVLDCTHVIGGPITARTLTEFGTNTLHISRVDYPDHLNWRLETDIGKRAAYCDLRDPRGRADFYRLLQDADIFTCSYMNLDEKGISPKALAEAKPGIIAHELRCFDFEGEWANFRGFDMLAIAVSGYVDEEGAVDAPLMPVQNIFADYLAGYVGAAAITAALLKRATEGGSWQVRISLTRMCMWAQDIGLLDRSALSQGRPWADLVKEAQLPIQTIDGPFGEISYLPSLFKVTDLKPGFDRSTQPLGSSKLAWS